MNHCTWPPLLAMFALAACGSRGGGTEANSATAPKLDNPCANDPCAANPCVENPCAELGTASPNAAADFSGWETWTRKTPARFLSKSHSRMWVEVYVDAAASAPFDAKRGPYPVGARIVKAQHSDESSPSVKSMTVMKKMAPGYDPDNGDWYYGVYTPEGKATSEGAMPACIQCHSQVEEQDYVFGRTK